MDIDTALLGLFPNAGDGVVLKGLVNNLWDKLGTRLDQTGIGGWEVGAVDGVCRGIFDEKGEESEYTAHEESNDDAVDEDEDEDTTPHLEGTTLRSRKAEREDDRVLSRFPAGGIGLTDQGTDSLLPS